MPLNWEKEIHFSDETGSHGNSRQQVTTNIALLVYNVSLSD